MVSKFEERMRSKTAGFGARADADAAARGDEGRERPLVTMPAQLGAFRLDAQEYQRKIAELQTQLSDAQREGSGGVDLPVEKLHEVPGRRRYMSPEKYAELRENLRHNKMIQPVVVLPRSDGEWDIWSGHHRWDSHKELGRATIRCVLGNAENETEATDGAFFANLLQSDLTDYEKYAGFKQYQENHAGLSQVEIAQRTGLAQQQVSLLFAFERLPSEALTVIKGNKSILGATAAAELAAISEAGKADRVIEAVNLLADKKLDQTQAIKHARASNTPKQVPTTQTERFKIKAGKAVWCDVRRLKNVMRLEFKSEEQAEAAQEAIRLHLESLASVSHMVATDKKS
jgi:ParB family chromosome partitioning protein